MLYGVATIVAGAIVAPTRNIVVSGSPAYTLKLTALGGVSVSCTVTRCVSTVIPTVISLGLLNATPDNGAMRR